MVYDANNLGIFPSKVWVTMVGAMVDNMALDISLHPYLNYQMSTLTSRMTFSDNATPPPEVPLARGADTKTVYDQMKAWAEVCHRGHTECGNITGPAATRRGFCTSHHPRKSIWWMPDRIWNSSGTPR